MIRYLIIMTLLLSCIGQTKKIEKIQGKIPNDKFHGGGVVEREGLSTDISIKNFNQYNMSLSKLTGISRAEVVDEFARLKNSLPSSTKATSYNSFTQLAYTRLSSTYCSIYVDQTEELSSENLLQMTNLEVVQYFLDNFLDKAPSDNPDIYKGIISEGTALLNNRHSSGETFIVTSVYNPATGQDEVQEHEVMRVRLTKMLCSAILSSTFVVLL